MTMMDLVKKATRTLKIVIQSGPETCAYEFGRLCPYVGTRKFGTEFVCVLFPSDDGAHTKLGETDKGWLKRCPDCLAAERE
jgi:hypothetical protein